MIPNKEFLRTDEVREILRVSRATLYRMLDEGDIPATKPKGRRNLLIKRTDVIKYLEGDNTENQ